MYKTRLTVLLPNYNNEPYLKDCLDSLLNQTMEDFLIFFIDDCSTDGSVDIVSSYSDKRIIIFRKSQQSGIVDTLNYGLKKVDSEYFIRMDGDDIATLDRFEKLIGFMDANRHIDICGSAIKTFGVRDDIMQYGTSIEKNKASLIFGHSIGHASCIFRTKTITRNKILYKDKYWRLEDYHLFYRLKDLTNTTSLGDVLYLYRQEEYNVNNDIEKRKSKAYRHIYMDILKDLNNNFQEKDSLVHLELAKRAEPTFTLPVYKKHISNLITANNARSIFPKTEFDKMLHSHLNSVIYRLIDNNRISLFSMLKLGFRNAGFLRYYLANKFKNG